MFQGSKGKTMKWVTLLKDFKEKVGLTQSPSSAAPSASASPPSSSSRDNNVFSTSQSSSSSPTRSLYFYILFILFFGFMLLLLTWLSLSIEKLLFEWNDLSVALTLICS